MGDYHDEKFKITNAMSQRQIGLVIKMSISSTLLFLEAT